MYYVTVFVFTSKADTSIDSCHSTNQCIVNSKLSDYNPESHKCSCETRKKYSELSMTCLQCQKCCAQFSPEVNFQCQLPTRLMHIVVVEYTLNCTSFQLNLTRVNKYATPLSPIISTNDIMILNKFTKTCTYL
ncbi:hypothetical protein FWK35_00032600, partial [Aphis craccivora]